MYSRQNFMAIEALMKEGCNSKRDSGEDGLFEDCRSCRFHRPYYTGQTCVFAVCPYSTQQVSTRKKPKKVTVTILSSSTIRG